MKSSFFSNPHVRALSVGLAAALSSALVLRAWNRFSRSRPSTKKVNQNLRITDLFVYPIKSCKGVRVENWKVGEYRFEFDRRWMIVTESEGMMITQRQNGKLCLVETAITPQGQLTITIPGEGSFSVGTVSELEAKNVNEDGKKRVQVQVWDDKCEAIEMDRSISEALSRFLDTKCRLVMFPSDFLRSFAHDFTEVLKHRSRESLKATFSDGFPFLLASKESLVELNRRLKKSGQSEIEMLNFRPNIVIEGCFQPHDEDAWKSIIVQVASDPSAPSTSSSASTSSSSCELVLHGVKPCQRCTTTTVDRSTGLKGKEPLVELQKYRTSKHKRLIYGPLFGQNMVHDFESVVFMAVGNKVSIRDVRTVGEMDILLNGVSK